MIWAPILALSMFVIALLIVVVEATMHDRRRIGVPAVNGVRAAALLSQWRRGMSKLDSAKEELGWLKVVFAAWVVIDASLVAWISQNYDSASRASVFSAIVAAGVITAYIVWINRMAYRKIRQLEDL